jgi:predicted metal-dependent HD superfamily phosphohydrolase
MADRSRWDTLWMRLGAKGDPEAVFDLLARRYSEPHRAYHTLGHVGQCLEEWDGIRGLAPHPEAAELAIWFHDVVYDPRAADNEVRSADLAGEICTGARLKTLTRMVRGIILDTRHDKAAATQDGALVADADLAILGRPPAEFAAYESGIRKEYGWIPEEEYRRGRADFLRRFLSRPFLYATAPFRSRYEAKARGNLRDLINRLEAKPGR